MFTWLGTYDVLLGPFDGIAITDYWLVGSRKLDLLQLYTIDGRYDYSRGFSLKAAYALLVGPAVEAVGLVVPAMYFHWSGRWLFGLLGGMVAYSLLMRSEKYVLSDAEYQSLTMEASPA